MNFIKKLLKKKSVIALIVLIVAVGGYYLYKAATKTPVKTSYVTAAAARGTITVAVDGTGQVSSSSQVEIKPNTSGTVVSLPVAQGQHVTQGQLVVALDSRTAQRAVSDAETALETAKLNLQKALEPIDALTKLQQENSLITANNTLQKATEDLAKAYDDGFTNVADAFLDLPTILTGLNDIIMGNNASLNQWNIDFYADATKIFDERATSFRDDAYNSFLAARSAYDKNFSDYKAANRHSDPEAIAALIDETHATTLAISEAVKDINNLVQLYKDKLTEKNLRPITLADTHLSALNGYTGTTNSNISTLSSSKRTIDADLQSIDDAKRSLTEKQATIDKTNAGADALDIRSLQISIDQKQNALQDAKDKLADYYVRAAFPGIIAKLNIKKGDTVSSGTSVATLIADQQVADVSLNEVDVAKIKIRQKATLAFDAIDGLIITGEVSSIDLIGTVSQGVVSYNVKIVFDTQDDRIKSGMSVSAAIITDTHVDVLTVPNTAVKTQGGQSYVQVMENGKPARKTVIIGLANDTDTEIVGGINESDEVITQTITTGGTAKPATTSSSAIPGLGGGAVRVIQGGGNATFGR